MKYKTVDGRKYPVPNAKVDAFLNLRMSQRFHSNNSPAFNEDEQELARIRKELELCEILLPESTNVIGWLISSQGLDTVSRLYQRALDECDEHNIAGVPKPADTGELKRKGRLPREESKILRTQMLGILREHATMKQNPQKLALDVGVSEATIRRWINEEDRKWRVMQENCNSD